MRDHFESYFKSLDGQHLNYLRNWKLDNVAVDPAAVTDEYELKWVDPDKRLKVNTGAAKVETVAWLSDLTSFWRNRGRFNQSRLPTVADATKLPGTPLAPYDTLLITGSVTIPGIQGDDGLTTGDILVFLGGTPDNPASANQWVGIKQSNTAGVVSLEYEDQVVNLTADAQFAGTAAVITDVKDVVVRDPANLDITASLVITFIGNKFTLQSNTALTSLKVSLHGAV